MNNQMYTDIILLDLKKAFNTLEHGILSEKMNCFGFQASVNDLSLIPQIKNLW